MPVSPYCQVHGGWVGNLKMEIKCIWTSEFIDYPVPHPPFEFFSVSDNWKGSGLPWAWLGRKIGKRNFSQACCQVTMTSSWIKCDGKEFMWIIRKLGWNFNSPWKAREEERSGVLYTECCESSPAGQGNWQRLTRRNRISLALGL